MMMSTSDLLKDFKTHLFHSYLVIPLCYFCCSESLDVMVRVVFLSVSMQSLSEYFHHCASGAVKHLGVVPS